MSSPEWIAAVLGAIAAAMITVAQKGNRKEDQ